MNRIIFAGSLSALLAGCIKTDYELELAPQDASLQRTLKISRHGSEESDEIEEDVARLAKEYGVKVPVANNQQTFRGKFDKQMPNDIGGWGRFVRFDSPLGSATGYIERFRGTNDLVGVLERKQAAANQIVDLLIGWLTSELNGHPRWPVLREFLNGPFRHDLYNAALMVWRQGDLAGELTGDSKDAGDGWTGYAAIISQYLMEQGYFVPDEIPAIQRALADVERGDGNRICRLIQGALAREMEYGPDDLPEFEFVRSIEAMKSSLTEFLKSTEEFQTFLSERESDEDFLPDSEAIQEFGGLLMAKLFLGIPQLAGERLQVVLKTGRPAWATNGAPSEDSTEIHWSKELLPPGDETSRLIYAVWCEPNEEFQTRHFGAVAVDGEELIGYCLWYRGLTDDERGQWDALIQTLSPGPELKSKLSAFRFRDESDDVDPELRLSAMGAEAIIEVP